jgi:hypothetical protein
MSSIPDVGQLKMKAATAILSWSSMIVVCAAVLVVLVLDRYRYYDYKVIKCANDVSLLEIGLNGRFSSERPTERGNPYRLRIEVVRPLAVRGGGVVLDHIKLTSISSGKEVKLDGIEARIIGKPQRPKDVLVYLAAPMSLPYHDYQVSGEISVGKERSVPFGCTLQRSPRTGWRVRFWDALMSV